MTKSEFYYDLPQELIAQFPVEPRDHSRLLVMDRQTGALEDRIFDDIKEYLNKGDVIVINNSKVIPARLYGTKKTGANVEILLLKQLGNSTWECLVRPGKRLHKNTEVVISDKLSAFVEDYLEDGKRVVEFTYPEGENFYNILDQVGIMTNLKNWILSATKQFMQSLSDPLLPRRQAFIILRSCLNPSKKKV